jgi:hypothetical protein
MKNAEIEMMSAATANIDLGAIAISTCMDVMTDEQKHEPEVQRALHAYRESCAAWVTATHLMMASEPNHTMKGPTK